MKSVIRTECLPKEQRVATHRYTKNGVGRRELRRNGGVDHGLKTAAEMQRQDMHKRRLSCLQELLSLSGL